MAALASEHVILCLITREMLMQPTVQVDFGRKVELLQADDVSILPHEVGADGIRQFGPVLLFVGVSKKAYVVGDHLERRLPLDGFPMGLVVS